MTDEIVYEEEEVPGTELELRPPTSSPTLFHTDDPVQVIESATRSATALAQVIEDRKLFKVISGKKHVLVEGWELLGSMLGVFPVVVWSRRTEDGWEARVEARTRDGAIVGAAEAQCSKTEKLWKTREDYALRSMAQTRATSKALRMPLGFVMQLAGFDPTPEAEMLVSEREPRADKPTAQRAVPPQTDGNSAASRSEKPRKERMQERILELIRAGDEKRGVETTTAEVAEALQKERDTTPEKASEEDLEWLGTELGKWLASESAESFVDWACVPF